MLDAPTFDDLCDSIILERLKNALPDGIATYFNKLKVTTTTDAAVSADKNVPLRRAVLESTLLCVMNLAGGDKILVPLHLTGCVQGNLVHSNRTLNCETTLITAKPATFVARKAIKRLIALC